MSKTKFRPKVETEPYNSKLTNYSTCTTVTTTQNIIQMMYFKTCVLCMGLISYESHASVSNSKT